jgi:hypothetical protein
MKLPTTPNVDYKYSVIFPSDRIFWDEEMQTNMIVHVTRTFYVLFGNRTQKRSSK